MNLFKLTYENGHAVLIDVLNTQHAIQVCDVETRRTEGKCEVQLWDDVRGDYLCHTYAPAPCMTRPCALESIAWYELPIARQMKVSNGTSTITKDIAA